MRNAVKLGAHSIWLTVDTVAVSPSLDKAIEADVVQLGKRERERKAVAQARPVSPRTKSLYMNLCLSRYHTEHPSTDH